MRQRKLYGKGMSTRATHHGSGWLVWILTRLNLLAFLAASMLAPGVMPARGADGTVELVICTGNGPALITLPQSGDAPPESPRDDRPPCAFAMAQAPAALPAALPALTAPSGPTRRLTPPPRARAPLTPAAHRFHARAPPVPV